MHKRITELNQMLSEIMHPQIECPTQGQHNVLLALQQLITYVAGEEGVILSYHDEMDRQSLYTLCTKEVDRQEAFFKSNSNMWAT